MPDYFPKWLHHFTFPQTMYEGSNFSRSLPTLTIVWVLYYSHPNGCEVALTSISLVTNDVEYLFISFGRNFYSKPLPIFNWLLCFVELWEFLQHFLVLSSRPSCVPFLATAKLRVLLSAIEIALTLTERLPRWWWNLLLKKTSLSTLFRSHGSNPLSGQQ